jgi:hypothetical protein
LFKKIWVLKDHSVSEGPWTWTTYLKRNFLVVIEENEIEAVITTPLFPNLYDDRNLCGGDESFADSTEH